jgi:hypothetical protein
LTEELSVERARLLGRREAKPLVEKLLEDAVTSFDRSAHPEARFGFEGGAPKFFVERVELDAVLGYIECGSRITIVDQCLTKVCE